MMNTTRLISYRELVSAGAWPVTRCLREVEPGGRGDYFFVSHPWLSKEHPDPEGVKWRVLAGWWRRLKSLRGELLQADPAGLSREEQKRWVERRFEAAPVAAKSHYNDWGNRLFGWEWAAFGGTGDDPRRASREFHGWLLASIDGVLDGHLWIDSHATAPKSHRESCAYCRAEYEATIKSLPVIVARSTCVRMSGLVADEAERGWLLLEASVAARCEALVRTNKDEWSESFIEDVLRRLGNLEYRCTEREDAVLLPRMDAAFQSYGFLTPRREHPVFRDGPVKDLHVPLIEVMLGDPELDPLERIERVVGLLTSPAYCDDVMGALLSLEGGRYLMLTAAWNVFGVIRSEMYRRGVPVEDFGDLITHLQACLYVCICRTRLEPREAARMAVRHWQDRTGIRLFPLTAGRRFFGLRREHAARELAQLIDRVYAFWSGAGEGTIDIYVQDFCPTLKAS